MAVAQQEQIFEETPHECHTASLVAVGLVSTSESSDWSEHPQNPLVKCR